MKACVKNYVECRRVGFGVREDGSLTIFSLFLFILILMIAGTAVDLIRHERERVAMQNTLDAAVLAASSVSQGDSPEAVVRDYVMKAGFNPASVQIGATTNYVGNAVTGRTVTASSIVTIDTMFMDMMGIGELNSPTQTSAMESNTKLEIVLVLDISDSMNSASADPAKTKIAALKEAAKEFVQVIFASNDPQDVSISIVPYNHQVVMPDSIMSRLSLNGGTVRVASPAPYPGALTEYERANANSRCLVFGNTDFDTRRLTVNSSANLSARFLQDRFWWSLNGVTQQDFQTPYEWANWCSNAQPRILPYTNTKADIDTYIDNLWAFGATAINIGMNWGTAMLDPSFRPVVRDMVTAGEVASELDIFPTTYGTGDSQKYVVLMTDGINTNQYDLDTPYKAGPTRIWYSASKTTGTVNYVNASTGTSMSRNATNFDGYYVLMPNNASSRRWYKPGSPTTTSDDQYFADSALPSDAVQLDYHELYERFGVRAAARFFFENSDYTAYQAHFNNQIQSGYGNANTNSEKVCDQAKTDDAITVYTVAFEANASGETLLQYCATAPGFYFDVDGTQISDAFSAIANQIALLRLTE